LKFQIPRITDTKLWWR